MNDKIDGPFCERLARTLFMTIADEVKTTALAVTVSITRNIGPNEGKTSLGVAASWNISAEEEKQCLQWAIESIDSKHLLLAQ